MGGRPVINLGRDGGSANASMNIVLDDIENGVPNVIECINAISE